MATDPHAASAAKISLADLRHDVTLIQDGKVEGFRLSAPAWDDAIAALLDVVEIVRPRRARFNVKPYPADWHPKNAEEQRLDDALDVFGD